MGDILTGFWTALELCFFNFFTSGVFEPKVSRKRRLICLTATWMIFLLMLTSDIPQAVCTFLCGILYILLSALINRGKWYQHILAASLTLFLSIIIDTFFVYGSSAILDITVNELIWKKRLYTVIVTLGKLLYACIGWYIYYFGHFKGNHLLRGKWLPLSVLFTAGSSALILSAFLGAQNENDIALSVVFFCSVVVAANVVVLYLVSTLEKSVEKLKEAALLNQQLDIQTEHIVALEKSYRAQRQYTHDFCNHLQTISDLLDTDKPEEAKNYTKELLGQQTTRIFAVNSHHPIIDAVLNLKYQLCREQGIDIRFRVNDLSGVNLPTDLLVVLLSNLLDNAIEGCCRANGKKKLSCSLVAEETLFLSVRNTANPVTIVDNRIPTSKENKQEHGYGMALICSVMEKLHGEYAFDYRDGWFSFVAEIPLYAEKTPALCAQTPVSC